jgi:hypothetical protein
VAIQVVDQVQKIKIHIDLAATGAVLGARIEHLAKLVDVGLLHGETLEAWPAINPMGKVTYQYGPTGQWSPDQVRNAWSQWILANGFRDLAELVTEFLEVVQDILAKWDLQILAASGAPLKSDNWNEIVVKRFREFHRLGFPQKLAYLSSCYGFSPNADFVEYMKTIIKVRNCMVHNNGQVRAQDCNEESALVLQWDALAIIVTHDSNQREAAIGETLPSGALVGMQHRPRSKSFEVGSRITIERGEFSEVAWTIRRFGSSIIKQLEEHGRERGIRFNQDKHQEKDLDGTHDAT